MKRSPVWKSSRRTVGQEIPSPLMQPEISCYFLKNPTIDPYLLLYNSSPVLVTYVFRMCQVMLGCLCLLVEARVSNRVQIAS
jgi:hypothetical protein